MGKKYLLVGIFSLLINCVLAQKSHLILIAESESLVEFPNHKHSENLAFTPHWLWGGRRGKKPLMGFKDRDCKQIFANAEAMLMSLTDTISTFDPETFEPILSVVPYCIDYYSFNHYKIYQRVYLDTLTKQLLIIPFSFAPAQDIYDRNDNFISHKPLFWFPINNSSPKWSAKITWAERVVLKLSTADFHFIEKTGVDLVPFLTIEQEWVWNTKSKQLHIKSIRVSDYK